MEPKDIPHSSGVRTFLPCQAIVGKHWLEPQTKKSMQKCQLQQLLADPGAPLNGFWRIYLKLKNSRNAALPVQFDWIPSSKDYLESKKAKIEKLAIFAD